MFDNTIRPVETLRSGAHTDTPHGLYGGDPYPQHWATTNPPPPRNANTDAMRAAADHLVPEE